MAYEKTNWQDTLRDAQGNVIQKGTPLNAQALGKIEDGIVAAEQKIDTEIGKVTTQLAQTETQLETTKINLSNTKKESTSMLFDDTGSLKEITTTLVSNSTPTTTQVAFPAFIKFADKYLTFYRRGSNHNSYDGKLVFISSSDGVTWGSETVIAEVLGRDYRDPSVIVFNGKLVVKSFYRVEGGASKTVIKSTADLVTWSTEVEVTSLDNVSNATRGNMTINNNVLYMINYQATGDLSTFLVSTSDLSTFNIVGKIKDKTNEASIVYVGGKFISVLRQAIYTNGNDYSNPILWGESTDGITWTFKELSIYGHCPSLHVLSLPLSVNRLLVTYRDPSKISTMNRSYYNFALFDTDGELFASRLYNMLYTSNSWDIGYGDVFIDTNDVYICYYYGGNPNAIVLKKFKKDDMNKFSSFYSNEDVVKYLNGAGTVRLARMITPLFGDFTVTGDGTGSKAFTIDLTPLKLTGALLFPQAIAIHSSGGFTARITSSSLTQISGVLKADTGTFSTSIPMLWSAFNTSITYAQ